MEVQNIANNFGDIEKRFKTMEFKLNHESNSGFSMTRYYLKHDDLNERRNG